jgi:hypothetical protein
VLVWRVVGLYQAASKLAAPEQDQCAEQVVAYQRKWDEELESFKKLVGRLQAAAQDAGTTQPGTPAAERCGCLQAKLSAAQGGPLYMV